MYIQYMNYAEITLGGKIQKFPIRDASDQSVFEEIFTDRLYRRAEDLISTSDLIIDIGAHAGFFSIYARDLNATAPIIALEPERKNFQALEDNSELAKLKNFTALNAAVVSEDFGATKTKLYLAPDSHNHSTWPNEKYKVEYVLAKKISELIAGRSEKKVFMKIDIEGAEKLLLPEWNRQTLWKISSIVLEYHNDSEKVSVIAEKKLRESGFSCETFRSPFDSRFGLIIARRRSSLV